MKIEDSFNQIPKTEKPEDGILPTTEMVTEQGQTETVTSTFIAPKDMKALDEKLKGYFHDYDPNNPYYQPYKENYLTNVNTHERLVSLIQEYPEDFYHIFDIVGDRVLHDDEAVFLANNFRQRKEEISKNKKELQTRIGDNPEATDEEYRLGTYKESIESQVRGAVFAFHKKGYSPAESGFLDLVEGSEYIGLNYAKNIDKNLILQSIVDPVDAHNRLMLKAVIKNVAVKTYEDGNRAHIILVPNSPTMPLADWKIVWDIVADCIPDLKDKNTETLVNNGGQGIKFRENQDRIKRAKTRI